MKKIILALGLIIAVNNIALADGNAFTPLNFNDTTYSGTKTISNTANSAASTLPKPTSSLDGDAIGNGNIQNAIQQLDNAQVDIRNDLLNCRTKYADIDAQYKIVKAERKALKKQVNSIERRIKEIDKAKEKIRKNML